MTFVYGNRSFTTWRKLVLATMKTDADPHGLKHELTCIFYEAPVFNFSLFCKVVYITEEVLIKTIDL